MPQMRVYTSYRVKWKSSTRKGDYTIEPRSNLVEDVPKLVKLFEKKYKVKFMRRSNNYKYWMDGYI